MPKMSIPRDKSGSRRSEKMKEKVCKYPGCEATYYGTGRSCYCEEHRSPQSRKDINKIATAKKKTKIAHGETANFEIIHQNTSATKITRRCNCCGEEYELTLFPNVATYSAYCQLHRNFYKRQMFKKNHNH